MRRQITCQMKCSHSVPSVVNHCPPLEGIKTAQILVQTYAANNCESFAWRACWQSNVLYPYILHKFLNGVIVFKNHLNFWTLTSSFLKFCWNLKRCIKPIWCGASGNGCAKVSFSSKTCTTKGTSTNFHTAQVLVLSLFTRSAASCNAIRLQRHCKLMNILEANTAVIVCLTSSELWSLLPACHFLFSKRQ